VENTPIEMAIALVKRMSAFLVVVLLDDFKKSSKRTAVIELIPLETVLSVELNKQDRNRPSNPGTTSAIELLDTSEKYTTNNTIQCETNREKNKKITKQSQQK
jgi:hypothetical protein